MSKAERNIAICAGYQAGKTYRELGQEFGISWSRAAKIVNRSAPKTDRSVCAAKRQERDLAILQMRTTGATQKLIALTFGLTEGNVGRICQSAQNASQMARRLSQPLVSPEARSFLYAPVPG